MNTEVIQFLKSDPDLYQTIRLCEYLNNEEHNDIDYIIGDSVDSASDIVISSFKNIRRIFAIFFPDFTSISCDEEDSDYLTYSDSILIRLETWIGIEGNADENFYNKYFILEKYFNKYFEKLDAEILEKFGYRVSSKMYNENSTSIHFVFMVDY